MNRFKPALSLICPLLIALTWAGSVATAQHEVPSHFPGYWYRIILDDSGALIGGDGDGYGGGTWYYYPDTGWYRQWYYNQPYDPDRQGYLRYDTYIKAIDPNMLTSVEISMTWTTPEWSALGLDHPPLPGDAPTAGAESMFMDGVHMFSLQDAFVPGSTEPIKEKIIEDYNPEWVAIDFRGSNVYVYRGAKHECLGAEGACCLESTGDCFLSTEEDCHWPYVWLGAGTSCAACGQSGGAMDYGDAPDTYKTRLASDGARHAVTAGIRLGSRIDSEADAQPNSTATGDNVRGENDEDGVIFTSPVAPGQSTSIEVTASTSGYLNAWIDFNRNGRFDDDTEQIFADMPLALGLNGLVFDVPANASAGQTFARFRFNSRGLLGPQGFASDGEVEDYALTVAPSYSPQSNSGKGGLKWTQPPQPVDASTPYVLDGWDAASSLHQHRIVADDWRSEDGRPITGFQWWGSFAGWVESVMVSEQPLAFHIAIWTDVPQPSDPAALSRPGTLAWETYCTNWAWSVAGQDRDPRGLSSDETCFQFTCLLSQDEWFYPDSTAATYWVSIAAVYDVQSLTPQHPWGWTTRPSVSHCGAVVIEGTTPSWPPSIGSNWLNGTPIMAGQPWDVAFELLTNQGSCAGDLALAPVYRFWSEKLAGHFYTISEEEKNALLQKYPDVWTFEGVVFYAYAPGSEPVGAKPVYRFWSSRFGHHFYTIDESEKDKLLNSPANLWAFEGIAWYAFD
ncbi:MAG: hypothetical protein JW993_16880 [Sedimentisphaerales bacterium]|nr:hypothetical protein [Sedimentisphaerales bacterium]